MSLVRSLAYRRDIGRAVLAPAARWGLRSFDRHRRTPRLAYSAMRKLFGNDDPRLFEDLVEQVSAARPPLDLPDDPPGLAAGQVSEVARDLDERGWSLLSERLDEASCADLERVARATRCHLVDPTEGHHEAIYDEDAPVAVRYDVPEEAVLASSAAQRVVADASLLAVAQAHLGAAPVQDLVAMWWSTSVNRAASDAAAQQYHVDLDRLRFLKVFVLLTDVDEETGPHVFVEGSHRAKPAALRHDGRHDDAAVEAAFPGARRTISGPRGTVFVADTLALHKGEPLRRGHRLMFQTEYAISLYGSPYTRPSIGEPGPELAAMMAAHPSVFERFGTSGGA